MDRCSAIWWPTACRWRYCRPPPIRTCSSIRWSRPPYRSTAAVAATLAPLAAALYRPFPQHPLSTWDLLRFGARGAGRHLGTIFVMGTLGGLVSAVVPLATGAIFSDVIPGAARNQLLQITLGLVAAALAAAGFQITRGFALLRLEGRLGAAIQAGVWDRLLSLPAPSFASTRLAIWPRGPSASIPSASF